MFTEERLDEILNILNIEGKVKVKDLSQRFNVDGNYKFAILDDINTIITDEKPGEKIMDILTNSEIELI